MTMSSYTKIFSPISQISKTFGTHLTKNSKLSKLRTLQSALSLSAIVTLSFYYFFKLLKERVQTLYFLVIFRYFSFLTGLVLIVISNFWNYQNVPKILAKLAEIDHELTKFGLEKRLKKADKSLEKWSKIHVFGFNVTANVLGALFSVILRKRPQILHWIVLTYPRIVLCNFNSTFFILTMMVEERFKIVNIFLKKCKKQDFDITVTKFIKIHSNLVRLVEEINRGFNLLIMFFVAIDFILLFWDLYIIANSFIVKIVYNNRLIPSLIKNCIYYTLELMYFTRRSAKLCFEVFKKFFISISNFYF